MVSASGEVHGPLADPKLRPRLGARRSVRRVRFFLRAIGRFLACVAGDGGNQSRIGPCFVVACVGLEESGLTARAFLWSHVLGWVKVAKQAGWTAKGPGLVLLV